jgi:two-component system response regulator FixJ
MPHEVPHTAQKQSIRVKTESVSSPPPSACAKVFIVDDDPDLCLVLAAILHDAGRLCESFHSASTFLDSIGTESRGCVLLDIRMPGMTGPELQAVMAERGLCLPIIFLSAAANVRTAVEVLHRGAFDLIEKPCERGVLLAAVQKAMAHDAHQSAQRRELQLLQERMDELTPREHEVAELLAGGNSNRQTALALGLSERTVEIHRARIMAKMQCDSIVNFGIQWLKIKSARKSSSSY